MKPIVRRQLPTPLAAAWKGLLPALLALLPAFGDARAAPPPKGAEPAVALVVALRGEALRSAGPAAPVPLRLFDKLVAGEVVETRAGAELRLVFAQGGRYAVGPASRVRLGGSGPVRQSGTLTELERLPAALSLSPISPLDDPGDRFPTIVIRTQPITGVYPRGEVALPAEGAVLQFDPVPGTERYRVVVYERSSGDPVLRVETVEPRLAVPPGKLRPGTQYRWSVATVGRIGPRAEGKGGFTTSTAEAESARAALDAALATEPEGEALLLKAAVDFGLGRFREGYEELLLAQGHFPGDDALRAAVESWRRRLELGPPAAPPREPPPPPGG